MISASASMGSADKITLFTVSENGTLIAKSLDVTGGTINAQTVIEQSVRMVSGSLRNNLPACYYIKDNAVKLCEFSGVPKIVHTGIKNACKIASTPNFGGAVAVIGYDRAATLYVD